MILKHTLFVFYSRLSMTIFLNQEFVDNQSACRISQNDISDIDPSVHICLSGDFCIKNEHYDTL